MLMLMLMEGGSLMATAAIRDKHFAEEFKDEDWYKTIHDPLYKARRFRVINDRSYEVTEAGLQFIKDYS
jgi:hypothetical protein